MNEVLKGTISNALGLRDALECITSMKEVNSGVLAVSSQALSGRLGIAWGRFVTGALLDSGESGRSALRALLCLRDGTFVFFDTDGEPVDELRQSLGIDLNGVVPYVPEEITAAVTPWLFDSKDLAQQQAKVADAAPTPEVDGAVVDQVEDKADRVLAQLQRVVGQEPSAAELGESPAPPPQTIIGVVATAQSTTEASIDYTHEMKPVKTAAEAAIRSQKPRSAAHQGDTVGIAILCVLFFVVSCAGTVIIGPRIAAVVTSAFHATH